MKKLLCRYVQYVNIFCSIISSTPLPGIPFGEFKQGSLYDVECNGISIVSTSLATFPFSCWFFFFRFFAGCNMHIRSLVTELLRFRDTAVALLWVSLILPYVLFHGCQSHRLLQRLLRLKILLNSIICCNCYNCEFLNLDQYPRCTIDCFMFKNEIVCFIICYWIWSRSLWMDLRWVVKRLLGAFYFILQYYLLIAPHLSLN